MPHMFQIQAVVVSNPPPHPTPNGDTLDDAALLFVGSVFDCQAHNLDTSPPTLQLLGQNLLSMSKILKRKQEEEDLHEAVSPALRELFKNLEKKMDEGFKKVDERFTKMDERFKQMDERFNKMDEGFKQMDRRSKRRFKRIEKRLERIEGTLNHQINHMKPHESSTPSHSPTSPVTSLDSE